MASMYLTHQQYVTALKLFREAIERGDELVYWDDNTPGDKDMECSWGLCSGLKTRWPDPETHMWPGDPRDEGSDRIYGVKHTQNNQLCPFDKREEHDGCGCFYSCRIFQSKNQVPTKEEALRLYDIKLAGVRK